MLDKGIDYPKTIRKNKIVYNDRSFPKRLLMYIFITSIPLGVCIYSYINAFIRDGKLSAYSYFIIAILFIVSTMAIAILLHINSRIYRLIIFDKVENTNTALIKKDLLRAAAHLYWEEYLSGDEFLVFKTPEEYKPDEVQAITLIIYPDHRIYFNSINDKKQYSSFIEYDRHFQSLKTEFKRLSIHTGAGNQ